MDRDVNRQVQRLRNSALRVTKQRVAVLQVLERWPHSDAGSVTAAVRKEIGTISKQAVYDVLTALTDTGLVRRVDVAGASALFEILDGSVDHHHAVCRLCGGIFDIDPQGPPHPPSPQPSGFVIDEIDVIYRGTCPACRPNVADAPDRLEPPTTTEEN